MAALALLLASGAAGAGQAGHDPRLSATLVGTLEPGETGRLAVRWDGEPGALLDAWIDLDGNGRRTAKELVVDGRPLVGGIEVVEFDVPAGALVASEPRLWATVREERLRSPDASGDALASESRDACEWQPGFFLPGLDGEVQAVAVFDDGTGPALYAGGGFSTAGGVTVNHVARWDGSTWSAMSGPSGTGIDSWVYALAVFDDGSGPALYAGGGFTTAGGVAVNGMARWDGSAWSPLSGPSGTGVNGGVFALAVVDAGAGPALYAGGHFITAGGVTVNSIARWDGTAWSALGAGVEGYAYNHVDALAAFDDGTGPALYAGGWFPRAGGVTVNNIARWDGTAWSALSGPSGTGVDGYVEALAIFDDGTGPALYAGGSFTRAGGVTVNNVARWDGSDWSDLSGPSGNGMDQNGYVEALAVFDAGSGPALYAGGRFTTAGGVTVNHVARWDGTVWSALSGPSGTGVDDDVYALAVFNNGTGPALYAGGDFTTGGGSAHIARWDGTTWSPLSGPVGAGIDGYVYDLAVFNDGSRPALYAGGYFYSAGTVTVSHVARWDGAAWSALSGPFGTGVDGSGVSTLAVFDDGTGPDLYAGGYFTAAGGVAVNNIARWNGSAWSALSGPSVTGVDDNVYALAVFDDGSGPALYAGGYFTTAGGVTVNHVARWDGTAWSALAGPSGAGIGGPWVATLAVLDDGSGTALYAGGDFLTAGGVTVNNIARWDGSAWSALSGPSGTGVNDRVNALAVFDGGSGPELYAGGSFTLAGGVPAGYIARWDGTAWSPVKAVNWEIDALAVFDDVSEHALYAGGDFWTAGGVTVNHVARWDGVHWSALSGPSGIGVNSGVYALTVFDDGSGPEVYAGGDFAFAGGLLSNRIAAWRGPCSSIFADGFETGDTSAWAATVP